MKRALLILIALVGLSLYLLPQSPVEASQESPSSPPSPYTSCGTDLKVPTGTGPHSGTPMGPKKIAPPLPKDEQEAMTTICKEFHKDAVGLVGRAYCLGDDCFSEHQGDYFSVVATGHSGEFPKTWTASISKGGLDKKTNPGIPCEVPSEVGSTDFPIQIPADQPKCKTERVIGKHLYHEHFASNPVTGCLAWMECREDLREEKETPKPETKPPVSPGPPSGR